MKRFATPFSPATGYWKVTCCDGLLIETGEAMREDLIDGLETMDTEVRSYKLQHGRGEHLGGRKRPADRREDLSPIDVVDTPWPARSDFAR